jgi:putative phage-type endonuclease
MSEEQTPPIDERAAWLEARRLGLGGSDAAPALGLSKWKSPLVLYLDKIGELTTIESEPMRWGTAMEPIIRQRYADDNRQDIVRPPMLKHPKHEWMLGNVDGLIGKDKILEIKTARSSEGWGEVGSSEIPDEYMLQVQHYLCVTHRVVADVAVLIGGSDYRVYTVEADREIAEMLLDGEAAFWHMVQSRTPPEASSLDDAKRRWPKSRLGIECKADTLVIDAIGRLRGLKNEEDRIKNEIDACKLVAQALMQEADTLVTEKGTALATWKSTKPGKKFDTDTFKAAHPGLYAEFCKPTEPQRRFLLKGESE